MHIFSSPAIPGGSLSLSDDLWTCDGTDVGLTTLIKQTRNRLLGSKAQFIYLLIKITCKAFYLDLVVTCRRDKN